MLIDPNVIGKRPTEKSRTEEKPEATVHPAFRSINPVYRNVANREGTLQKQIGMLERNVCVNFWSFGSFSLHELMFYILRQTGPAHINMCTWSISQEAVEQITRRYHSGEILSIRFLLDPRVKVCKAKPLQMLTANFDYAMTRVHAKVVTLENEEWKLSIVSSQNATTNPKLERGMIIVSDDVFDFDKAIFEDEFKRNRVRNGDEAGRAVLYSTGNSLDDRGGCR
ncbi:MAG: hypothetical protein EGP82_08710 [Odoribacter splanchnicus]|nr:hypothetical protein [Odoribacter splanchnicus]